MKHKPFLSVSAVVLSLIIINCAVSANSIFTIPNYVTYGEEFYLCGGVPLPDCIAGTETISYIYGTSDGELSAYETELNVTKNILCTSLFTEDYQTDYPNDTVEIQLYNSGYCDIDGVNYPITVSAYTYTGGGEVKLSINGHVDWYSVDEQYVIDEDNNARFKVENIRETAYTTYVEIFCDSDKIVTETYDYVYMNGSCDDKNKVDVLTWSDSRWINIGKTYIYLLTESERGYIYGNVSETITFMINLLDENSTVLNGDVDFAVRNCTGEILTKSNMTYSAIESAYIANYTFDKDAPSGFVEFNAYSTEAGYGGIRYYFETPHYTLNLTINNSNATNFTYFLKDQIPMNISYENYRGEIISINTTIDINYDNGSVEIVDIPLNITDNYYVYDVGGNAPGNYTLTTKVYHSTGENRTYTKNITIEGFFLHISTDPVWEAGDNITFSAWVEDRRSDVPVIFPCTATFILVTPSSQNIELSSSNKSDYKQTAEYCTTNETAMGYYTIKVLATDAYEYEYYGEYRFSIGGIYTNQFIEVKLPEKFTINTTGNHSVNFSIENIKGQKLYNLEVQEDYDEEYIDVNMSDPVDIDKDKTINITTIIISSQELENGNYEEILEIIVCGDTLEMPLIFDVDINPRAEITNDDFDGVEFNMTIFKDITSQENIKIKNIGQRDMETPAIYFLGNDLIENATAVQPAGTVAVNESVNVVVKFYFDEVKTYTGTLWVSAPNMADIGYNITITVLEGMTSRIDVLSDRLALAGNLRDQLEYNATIKKLDINFSKIDEMILNTTNLRSYILSKSIDPENYEDIKDNITEFEAMLDKIDEDLEDMEKSYKLLIMPKGGDGKCDESESCSSSDCEYEKRCITEDATEKENVCGDSVCSVEDNECSTCPADCPSYLCEAVLNPTDDEGGQQSPKSFTFIIIAAVIILLIGSVLITSLVPEKEDGTKSSASFDI